jgi:hypothetical protein
MARHCTTVKMFVFLSLSLVGSAFAQDLIVLPGSTASITSGSSGRFRAVVCLGQRTDQPLKNLSGYIGIVHATTPDGSDYYPEKDPNTGIAKIFTLTTDDKGCIEIADTIAFERPNKPETNYRGHINDPNDPPGERTYVIWFQNSTAFFIVHVMFQPGDLVGQIRIERKEEEAKRFGSPGSPGLDKKEGGPGFDKDITSDDEH